jgi:hypothetical protein
MRKEAIMNTIRISLLLLIMIAVTNTVYAGQDAVDGQGTQTESDCDYSTGVDTLRVPQ